MNNENEMDIRITSDVREGFLYLKPEMNLDGMGYVPLFFIDSTIRFEYSTRKYIQSIYKFISSDELNNIVNRIFKKYVNSNYADDAFVLAASCSITREQLKLEHNIQKMLKKIRQLNSQREQTLTVHQFQYRM